MSTCNKQLEMDIPHPEPSSTEKHWAIQHWRDLADEQERDVRLGLIHPSTGAFNANLYRRTARSIEIGVETGEDVCVCCFKPFGRGALQH